jgi:hypothetical protein
MGMYIPERDSDGRMMQRAAITDDGWKYQACHLEFTTSLLASDYSVDHLNANFGNTSLKFYDAGDAELTLQADIDANCVKTVYDFEPTHDYDIKEGAVYQATAPANDLRVWAVAVPRIPAASGGEVEFLRALNMKFLPAPSRTLFDGVTAKRMPYDGTYHTNEFRFTARHVAGIRHDLMFCIELYKA